MIPKIIHQVWKDDRIPARWQAWHESWKRCFPSPEFTHMLWTDEAARDFVAREYSDFLEVYDGYPEDIQRADAIRYMVLHHFGGIYADLDCECLARFDEELEAWPGSKSIFLPTCRPPVDTDLVQNSLMASVAGHEFWLQVLEQMRAASTRLRQETGPEEQHVLETTGPYMLQRAYLESGEDQVALLPKYQFNLERCREGDLRQIIRNLFSPAPRVFVLHHYSGSWKERKTEWLAPCVLFVRRTFGDRVLALAGLTLLLLAAHSLRAWLS